MSFLPAPYPNPSSSRWHPIDADAYKPPGRIRSAWHSNVQWTGHPTARSNNRIAFVQKGHLFARTTFLSIVHAKAFFAHRRPCPSGTKAPHLPSTGQWPRYRPVPFLLSINYPVSYDESFYLFKIPTSPTVPSPSSRTILPSGRPC